MNQDSEQNDRGNEPRRDGNRRSYGRRDDDAQPNRGPEDRNAGPRPRFSRGDAPRDDTDRPRFSRDRSDEPARPREDRRSDDRPGFNRSASPRDTDRNDRPRSGDRRDNDRFRDDNRRSNGSFGERRSDSSRDNDRPRFDRNAGSPDRGPRNDQRFSKDNDRTNDRPRFDRNDRNDSDRPRFNRSASPRDNRRSDERPRFERDDRPRDNDRHNSGGFSERRSGFDRPGGPRDRSDADQPRRFNRDDQNDRPRFGGNDRRSDDRPRFGRDNRNGDRPNRFDKPGFKRVGGYSREADERNHDNQSGRNDDRPRFDRRDDSRGGDDQRSFRARNDRSDDRPNTDEPRPFGDRNTRFSAEQRKESGERRTGRYEKAPDYDRRTGPRPYRSDDRKGRFTDARGRSADRGPRDDKPRRPAGDRSRSEGDSELTRLNRYIANSGVCSRREADELIARGDISVNGRVVTEMGYKVKPGDTVKYGTKVLNPEKFAYVLLNKPKDYLTTTDDPEERKTVMELVADAGNFRLYPVGRLDRNTTGLLLLTNDGELADKLTHPSYNVRKIYQVELDKPITTEHFEALQRGIELEDGPIKPDALSIVTPDAHVVGIEIHSGRNRIVRRMFEQFGYEVTKLDRTTYAGLTKKELPRGKWRFLDPKEVIKLKYLS